METKDKATTTDIKTSYEDFEPRCKWKREEENDYLDIELPGFKKEQIRIQLKKDVLVITGEGNLKNNIQQRFQKQIKMAKHCKPTEIRAKFNNREILTLTIPKKVPKRKSDSIEDPNLNASLPSAYLLLGQESSSLRVIAVAPLMVLLLLLVMAFGAFVYKCCCPRIGY